MGIGRNRPAMRDLIAKSIASRYAIVGKAEAQCTPKQHHDRQNELPICRRCPEPLGLDDVAARRTTHIRCCG